MAPQLVPDPVADLEISKGGFKNYGVQSVAEIWGARPLPATIPTSRVYVCCMKVKVNKETL